MNGIEKIKIEQWLVIQMVSNRNRNRNNTNNTNNTNKLSKLIC